MGIFNERKKRNKSRDYEIQIDTGVAKKYGCDISERMMTDLCKLSEDIVVGNLSYKDAISQLEDTYGKNHYIREGNQRLVLIPHDDDYVIKIAKLPGWESLTNNENEFDTFMKYHTLSVHRKKHYFPVPIYQIGSEEHEALVIVQERFQEIIEDIASKVKSSISSYEKRQEEIESKVSRLIVKQAYSHVADMLNDLQEEFVLDDVGIVSAAANYSFNNDGGWGINDGGNITWLGNYAPRCPECGAPLRFRMETQAALESADKALRSKSVRPTYICVATEEDQVGAHVFSTEEIFQRMHDGDEDVIMTKKEALSEMKKLKRDEVSSKRVKIRGEYYYKSSKSVIFDNEEVWKLYDEDEEFVGAGINADGDVIDMRKRK